MVCLCLYAVATDPAQLTASKKSRVNPFKTNQEGKLVITKSEGVSAVTSEAGGAGEGVEEMDTSEVCMPKVVMIAQCNMLFDFICRQVE